MLDQLLGSAKSGIVQDLTSKLGIGSDQAGGFLSKALSMLEGGITISNGAGDTADRGANFTIVDNVSSGSYFLRVRGQVISERISWLEYHAGLPATVLGNDLTGVTGYLLQSWDSDADWLADLDFVEALAANNIIGPYAYLLDADGNIGTIDYTEYETTVPAVFVYRTEGDFAPPRNSDWHRYNGGTVRHIYLEPSTGLGVEQEETVHWKRKRGASRWDQFTLMALDGTKSVRITPGPVQESPPLSAIHRFPFLETPQARP